MAPDERPYAASADAFTLISFHLVQVFDEARPAWHLDREISEHGNLRHTG
jgi:hypothetical protein